MATTIPMYIIGDSHVRSYNNEHGHYTTIFLGSGKKHNFSTWSSFFRLTIKLFICWLMIKFDNQFKKIIIMVVAGEPDARFASFGAYKMQKPHIKARPINKTNLKQIVRRFSIFSFLLSLISRNQIIFSAIHTPNYQMKSNVNLLNRDFYQKLTRYQIPFFNAEEKVFSNSEHYTGNSVLQPELKDIIHVNSNIANDLNHWLEKWLPDTKIARGQVKGFSRFFLKWSEKFTSFVFKKILS